MVAYFVCHIVGLRVPQLTVQHNLNRLFGFDIVRSTLNNLKIKAPDYYWITKNKILGRIIQGNLIHADETRGSFNVSPLNQDYGLRRLVEHGYE